MSLFVKFAYHVFQQCSKCFIEVSIAFANALLGYYTMVTGQLDIRSLLPKLCSLLSFNNTIYTNLKFSIKNLAGIVFYALPYVLYLLCSI